MMYKINDYQPGRKYAFEPKQEFGWHPDITEPEFWRLAEDVWDYTAMATAALYNYWTAIRYVTASNIPGDILECGVYLGGSIMYAAEILKRFGSKRKLYALDTFYGFTEHTPELDRDYTGKIVCDPSWGGADFFEKSVRNMQSVGYEHLEIIRGDIFETIPAMPPRDIAILRLDTDTYETTRFELDHLYPRVSCGGIVIIDDYGFNTGCARAVDKFIEEKNVMLQRHDRWIRSWVKP